MEIKILLFQATSEPQVQYVAHQPGQQVIMMTPQQINQPGQQFFFIIFT